jgi:hypothetical protein
LAQVSSTSSLQPEIPALQLAQTGFQALAAAEDRVNDPGIFLFKHLNGLSMAAPPQSAEIRKVALILRQDIPDFPHSLGHNCVLHSVWSGHYQ